MRLVQRNGKDANPENGRRMFEPAGLFLAAIVGTVGLISLLKGAIPLAALCLPLAALRLVCSHKHFDRE